MTEKFIYLKQKFIYFFQKHKIINRIKFFTDLIDFDTNCSNLQSKTNYTSNYLNFNINTRKNDESFIVIYGKWSSEFYNYINNVISDEMENSNNNRDLQYIIDKFNQYWKSGNIAFHSILSRHISNNINYISIFNVCNSNQFNQPKLGRYFFTNLFKFIQNDFYNRETICWLSIYVTSPYLLRAMSLYTNVGFNNPYLSYSTMYEHHNDIHTITNNKLCISFTLDINNIEQYQQSQNVKTTRILACYMLLQSNRISDSIKMSIGEYLTKYYKLTIYGHDFKNYLTDTKNDVTCFARYTLNNNIIDILYNLITIGTGSGGATENSGILGSNTSILDKYYTIVHVIDTFDSSYITYDQDTANNVDYMIIDNGHTTWTQGDTDGSVFIPETKFSFHTHPYIGYWGKCMYEIDLHTGKSINQCQLANLIQPSIMMPPSDPDFIAYFKEYIHYKKMSTVPLFHIVVSVEGIYIVSIHEEFIKNRTKYNWKTTHFDNFSYYNFYKFTCTGLKNNYYLLNQWFNNDYKYKGKLCYCLSEYYATSATDVQIKFGNVSSRLFKIDFVPWNVLGKEILHDKKDYSTFNYNQNKIIKYEHLRQRLIDQGMIKETDEINNIENLIKIQKKSIEKSKLEKGRLPMGSGGIPYMYIERFNTKKTNRNGRSIKGYSLVNYNNRMDIDNINYVFKIYYNSNDNLDQNSIYKDTKNCNPIQFKPTLKYY